MKKKVRSFLDVIKEDYPYMLDFSDRPAPRIRFFSVEAYNSFITKFKEYFK